MVRSWPYVFGVLAGVTLGLAACGLDAAWWTLAAAALVFVAGVTVNVVRAVRDGQR